MSTGKTGSRAALRQAMRPAIRAAIIKASPPFLTLEAKKLTIGGKTLTITLPP